MDVIQQQLVVKDWPLKKPGDEQFFGYVVAMGVFPRDWATGGMFAFVDFAYGDDYVRYRLPNDERLKSELLQHLIGNLETEGKFGEIYGKVWVTLTSTGYKVDLP